MVLLMGLVPRSPFEPRCPCALQGAMVANYPWDGRLDMGMQSKYHASPDDATFRMLAARYAALHSRMQESSEVRNSVSRCHISLSLSLVSSFVLACGLSAAP